jgi:hypothetical protein
VDRLWVPRVVIPRDMNDIGVFPRVAAAVHRISTVRPPTA